MLESIRLFAPRHHILSCRRAEGGCDALPCCFRSRIEPGTEHLVTARGDLDYPHPKVVPRRGVGEGRPDAASLAFLWTVIGSFP